MARLADGVWRSYPPPAIGRRSRQPHRRHPRECSVLRVDLFGCRSCKEGNVDNQPTEGSLRTLLQMLCLNLLPQPFSCLDMAADELLFQAHEHHLPETARCQRKAFPPFSLSLETVLSASVGELHMYGGQEWDLVVTGF